jgi:hypothetical protein
VKAFFTMLVRLKYILGVATQGLAIVSQRKRVMGVKECLSRIGILCVEYTREK